MRAAFLFFVVLAMYLTFFFFNANLFTFFIDDFDHDCYSVYLTADSMDVLLLIVVNGGSRDYFFSTIMLTFVVVASDAVKCHG